MSVGDAILGDMAGDPPTGVQYTLAATLRDASVPPLTFALPAELEVFDVTDAA